MISKILSIFKKKSSNKYELTDEDREKSQLKRQLNKNKRLQLELQEEQIKQLREELEFRKQNNQLLILKKQIQELNSDYEEEEEEEEQEEDELNLMLKSILSRALPQNELIKIDEVINNIPKKDLNKLKKLDDNELTNLIKSKYNLEPNLISYAISKIKA